MATAIASEAGPTWKTSNGASGVKNAIANRATNPTDHAIRAPTSARIQLRPRATALAAAAISTVPAPAATRLPPKKMTVTW